MLAQPFRFREGADQFSFGLAQMVSVGCIVCKSCHIPNCPTGTAIDQAGLLGLAPHYARAYLATFTFRQFVSTFEVFLFDFLHQLLLHNPWKRSSRLSS